MASLTLKERTASKDFNKKRLREPEGPESFDLFPPNSDLSSPSSPSGKSSKGGEKVRRLSSSLAPESAGSRDFTDFNFTLPMYTAELGSSDFPIYGQFHFTDPIQRESAPAVFSSSTGTTTESDPRLPGTAIANVNLDSLIFDHFTTEAVEAAGIPPIPPTADTYVIDALFHGHVQSQPQPQSTFSMTPQESGVGMASESHLDIRSGGLDMSSFGMHFVDFSEFAGASSGDMSIMLGSDHDHDGRSSGFRALSSLNNEMIVLWDELPFNT